MTPQPIFFAWTRSFWASVLAVVLFLSSVDDATMRSLGELVAGVLGRDLDAWGDAFQRIPPVAALLIAMQQRMHAARPYTLDYTALK